MALTVTRVNSGSGSSASTQSQAVTMSGSPTAGNLLVALWTPGGNNAMNTLNTPAGWTKYWGNGGTSSTTPSSPMSIWYRIAQAGDGTTWTFTGTGAANFMAVFVGEYDAGGPWVSVDDQHGDAQGTTVSTLTATATAANSQLLDFGVCGLGTGTSPTTFSGTWGSGWVDGGVVVGTRLAYATKDGLGLATSGTSTTWSPASNARMALGTFRTPSVTSRAIRAASPVAVIRAANF